MKVESECSCGAKLAVEFNFAPRYPPSAEENQAQKLIEQFRRDHKVCRISAAAKEVKDV